LGTLELAAFELVMTEVIAQTEETKARRLPGLQAYFAPGEPAGGTVRRGKPALPDVRGGLLSIPNDKVIVAIREGISSADGWETNTANGMPARYYDEKEFQGRLEMRPAALESQWLPEVALEQSKRMWQYLGKFDDGMADAFDLLMSIYITQATTPNDSAVCSLDDLLSLRGLQKRPGGSGRRGGYSRRQREAVATQLYYLQLIMIDLGNVLTYIAGKRKPQPTAIQSKLLTISDCYGQRRLDGSIDPNCARFIFQPGKAMAAFLLGPGRSTALLSIRALSYNPYKQKWEKRLCRFLAWQWRVRAREGNYFQPFCVRTLLENGCRESGNKRRESLQKERFEKALDTLCDVNDAHRPAATWQYDEASRTDTDGTSRNWLDWRVVIEPPDAIPMHYKTIERAALPVARPLGFGDRLAAKRQRCGFNLMQAAEFSGVSAAQLSRIERGVIIGQPSKETIRKLERWLAEGDQ
jgi:hypothetical protein